MRKLLTNDSINCILAQPRLKTILKITTDPEIIANLHENRAKSMLNSWNQYYMPTEIRSFLLKFYSNTLGLASRVAHFNPDHEQRCTFCLLENISPAYRESFEHLFFSCTVTTKCIEHLFRRCFNTDAPSKENYFLCNFSEHEEKNIPVQITVDIFRFLIWRCKQAKKTPNITLIIEELKFVISAVFKVSQKIKMLYINCDVFQDPDRRPVSP